MISRSSLDCGQRVKRNDLGVNGMLEVGNVLGQCFKAEGRICFEQPNFVSGGRWITEYRTHLKLGLWEFYGKFGEWSGGRRF